MALADDEQPRALIPATGVRDAFPCRLDPAARAPFGCAATRQTFWPWIAKYEAQGVCRHVYARAGRGAIAVFDVPGNDLLHRILNEWSDIIPAQFETNPLIDKAAAHTMLAAQQAPKK